MKYALLPVFAAVLMLSLPAKAEGIYRNFIWGVSPQDVRGFEKAVFYKEEDGSLSFLEDRKGRRTLIRYDFTGNKLWRVRFDYESLHAANVQALLDLAMEEQRELTALYGPPSKEELLWKSTLYKNHPKFWTRAFAGRDLTIHTQWDKDSTHVIFEASRNKKDPFYTIGYTIEDKDAAARLEAARTQLDWKTP